MPDRRRAQVVLLVLLAGLAVRAAAALALKPAWEAGVGVPPSPDSYPELARSLLENGSLGFAPPSAGVTTARGPGFPAWLAVGMLVVGSDLRWLALWASLPGACAAAWVAAAAAARLGRIGGLTAGLIAACHPLPVLVAGQLMSDDFFAATGWCGIAALCGAMGSNRRRWLWASTSGAMFAWHILTRANGILTLIGAIAALAAARAPEWGSTARRARLAAVVATLALVPALGWSVRSSRLEGRPVFVHSMLWYNFWLGEAIDREGPTRSRGEGYRSRQTLIAEAAGMPELARSRFWWGELTPRRMAEMERRLAATALQRIADEPLSFAWRCARGLADYWFRAETVTRSWQYAAAAAPVVLLALVGAAIGWRPQEADPTARACLLVAAMQCIASAPIIPMARYSVQVYPELAYLAGRGGAWLRAAAQGRRSRWSP